MRIQLSDHFTYRRLLRFTLPSIVMMIFTSIYSVVDGFFVSNFVGKTPFAAINLIFPFIGILGCFGFMLGTGGAALVSKNLGEGESERANRTFSMLTYVGIAIGVLLALLGIVFIEPLAVWMGADANMLPYCVAYGRILLLALPAFMLQNMFQCFFVTAEKPTIGLVVTVLAGVTNMVLDFLFVAVLSWGLVGAAVATVMSQLVGGVIPLIYFACKNNSLLRLGKADLDLRALWQSSFNGLSELVTNASISVVSMLFNFQLLRFAGENGVAAYGAVMYVSFVFVALYIGYSIGVSPVISYHYGAGNQIELKNLFRKSTTLIFLSSVLLSILSGLLASPLASLFVGYDQALFEMTVRAFRFYSISVLFSGICIFGSGFFTALNNGVVSAVISFLRMFLFQVITVMILPEIWQLDGIWYALFLPDMMASVVTVLFFVFQRKKYRY